MRVTLVIIRHGESEWNQKNLFTGWTDVDLAPTGVDEAQNAGLLLKQNEFDFDVCYTSYLKRAIHTLNLVLTQLDREWLPVTKTWKLNERHYGALQGLNKAETAQKYGDEQVEIWRRSFDVRPPKLSQNDERNPQLQEQYRNENRFELPCCESLEDTIQRVVPYFNKVIFKDMKRGKRVLIAAHGNSIRALVKHFENLSEQDIMGVNIPTGIPLVYEFDDKWNVLKKYYLGDPEQIRAKMQAVANQGKAAALKAH
jgi:phosphoglycerate mutase, BPG-dependent, family 1